MRNFIIILILSFMTPKGMAQEKEQDWPNLERYRTANQTITESKKYPKVVFMGNSITEGWVRENPEFFQQNNFAGRGIGGQTTPQMLIRFIPDVVDLKPKAVVILAGTNDIAGNTGFSSVKMITDNLKAMSQLAKANGIEVILSSILPVYEYRWSPEIEPISKIAQVNSWMKDYAAEQGFVYLDYFTPMADERKGLKAEYSEDGVHPNSQGYSVMEPLVLKAIEEALQD